jgi:hypothetical protein
MAKKAHPYRPKDANQLAKYLVELSTGQISERASEKQVLPTKPLKDEKQKDKLGRYRF